MKLKELPLEEKPREKAKKLGMEYLTNVELLSILFRCGTKEKSVKDFSSEFLMHIQDLSKLKRLRLHSLLQIHGMGEAKALSLMAAVELGKRVYYQKENQRVVIHSSQDVYETYAYFFLDELQEKFLTLYLNAKNEVIYEKVLFVGTANYSIVHPRDIFYEAILNNAVKILCIHNHPTGNVNPSVEDEKITSRLKKAGEILQIFLVDHMIIGKNGYYSFLERGKL